MTLTKADADELRYIADETDDILHLHMRGAIYHIADRIEAHLEEQGKFIQTDAAKAARDMTSEKLEPMKKTFIDLADESEEWPDEEYEAGIQDKAPEPTKEDKMEFYFGQRVRAWDKFELEVGRNCIFLMYDESVPDRPWVVGTPAGAFFCARIEPTQEAPYAMVPLGKNGELVKVEFGQDIEVPIVNQWIENKFIGYDPSIESDRWLTDSGCFDQIRFPQPKKPQRPEIKIDDPVGVRDGRGCEWCNAHFAGWVNGLPTAWIYGKTSHTTMGRYRWSYIKTTDGTIWPSEEGE